MMTAPRNPVALPRPFPSRYGTPVLRRVSTGIFTRRYFTHCLQCGFCHDQCCAHGVDVDLRTRANLEQHGKSLEAFTGIPRGDWFRKKVERDENLPGGGSVRTRVRRGRCVFLNPSGRGCLLHSYALGRGLDYHELKSIVDCLFPLTWEGDTLCAADEATDGSLVCLDTGPTLYRGARVEIAYYFGDRCVEALDRIEQEIAVTAAA